ncbi:kinase-like protein, partial [Gonapodya prolifera JEL478]
KYNALIMEKLGKTFEQLVSQKQPLTKDFIFSAARKIIIALYRLHALGIVHRDLKPHNIAVGETDETEIKLFDLGLTTSFITNDEKHIRYTDKRGLTGTLHYISPHVHFGVHATRRDDLLSLGYILVYLARGSLPWSKLKVDT